MKAQLTRNTLKYMGTIKVDKTIDPWVEGLANLKDAADKYLKLEDNNEAGAIGNLFNNNPQLETKYRSMITDTIDYIKKIDDFTEMLKNL